MTHAEPILKTDTSTISRRLDAVGWGSFFIWVGVALLAHLGWGFGLLGVGLVTLAVQVARRYLGLGAEPFWIVVGLLFLAGAIGELLAFQFNLLPVLLIVAGLGLLLSGVRRHNR
jgi:hypothetical protein